MQAPRSQQVLSKRKSVLQHRYTIEKNLRFLVSGSHHLTDEQFLNLFVRMFEIYDDCLKDDFISVEKKYGIKTF